MNRFWTALAVATLLLGANGCHHHNLARNQCGPNQCGHHGCAAGHCAAAHRGNVPPPLPPGYQHQIGPAGPATAQVAYPYYTTRGPRDFFLNEPMPLGY